MGFFSSTQPPPLKGIRVLEFAGLAPGPFCGLLLADYGADVVRVDRPTSSLSSSNLPTSDSLTRNKRSVTLDLKTPEGVETVRKLCKEADVVIDTFRPGVLEKLGLGPDLLCKQNTGLVYSRITGFRRDGKYKDMAGHDINYIAVSGALSLFSKDGKPVFPANILGDFAGGGLTAFTGILLALFSRQATGKGQVVEANMVDGSGYLCSMPRLAMDSLLWRGPRGTNLLDGGAPFYDVYETSDGEFVAVGALEPQFYAALLKGLGLDGDDATPDRNDFENWEELRTLFTATFLTKTRREWEKVFDGTDACVTPVKSFKELRSEGYDLREIVKLKGTPAKMDGLNWREKGGLRRGGKKELDKVVEEWCSGSGSKDAKAKSKL